MRIRQYRFMDDVKACPSTEDTPDKKLSGSLNGWLTGAKFTTNLPAYGLRIQTLPGLQFNLNSSLDWVTVGYDGVYELDLGNTQPLISVIRFSRQSLTNILNNYEKDSSFGKEGILIEIFYEGSYT